MVQSPQIEYLNICYVTSFYLFFTHFIPQNELHNQGTDTQVTNFSHEYTRHALEIWISGCSLFHRRELWTSKSAGANSTKSLKIRGRKRWYPKYLRVHAPNTSVRTNSLSKVFNNRSGWLNYFWTFLSCLLNKIYKLVY